MCYIQSKVTIFPGEIHLWFTFVNEISDKKILLSYEELLSSEEYEQYKKFCFEKDRHLYLVAHALTRTTLSRYSTTFPRSWQFIKNIYGKPEIIHELNPKNLKFNISHTPGLVLCGVVLGDDIGVDVEYIDRKRTPIDIAYKYFSPSEVIELLTVHKEKQKSRFFEYWTLKESYLKAIGKGLSMPLNQFSFNLSNDESLTISFDPKLKEESKNWKFWRLQPSQRHTAAVCVRNEFQMNYKLCIKKTVPLNGTQQFF